MKFNLEVYILKNIENKRWRSNEKIPIEDKLMEISGLSKMTVRKVIDKLREREILYSIQGIGVFVSPFHTFSNIERLTDKLKATSVTYLPCTSKIPNVLLKVFNKDFEIDENKIITYVKLYFVKDEIVAYTLNWLNNEKNKYTLKDIVTKNKSVFVEKDFNKVINTHKLEKTSSSDKNILLTKFEYMPTIYSYFIKKDRNIVLLRVSKIMPKFYQAFEVKNR